jgi:hypothetical protein
VPLGQVAQNAKLGVSSRSQRSACRAWGFARGGEIAAQEADSAGGKKAIWATDCTEAIARIRARKPPTAHCTCLTLISLSSRSTPSATSNANPGSSGAKVQA